MSYAAFDSTASVEDEINEKILSISEDRLQGFIADPFKEIARLTGLPLSLVLERIRAMFSAGTIRRIRLTLLANDLAPGALVAWKVPENILHEAFDFLFQKDPFSGHVVIRSTDPSAAGARYRLWSTLKVPQGFSLETHCEILKSFIGAEGYKIMPAKGIFTLGVGHIRRKTILPGTKSDTVATMHPISLKKLNDKQWKVLGALKKELTIDEIDEGLWDKRARAIGMESKEFFSVAKELEKLGVLGRFSTFLEHVKPLYDGKKVTKFNALFHWAVPKGMEIAAGSQIGRFEILTHCYWREAGSEFKDVNIMAVAHGKDKDLLESHKKAIDHHLELTGIPVSYTNIFWGGRSEIKPSEIFPEAYKEWLQKMGLDLNTI
ncbi:Lrp/AsnC family transcriptional regulator [Candidatus Methylacidiphilum infernorum]|uniref:Lrp/AsnC family transcriptional regulator n=1 Tax=Candidatus Methylacidiphilum infernorum TaxID=511746 RepID=A0ABX7PVX3_9BACT|nr:Lrp/AsnC family transcriptional regulator [Candidatus Methylacidiphilum infernorum]QSR87141.1 Lrp/AsnC family transcriptional regulator [Candidatus Methylacidiphilum infernorum]